MLLSYAKIKLFQQLLDSDVPEDPFLSKELVRYFPKPLQTTYADHMQRHRLKREIIATVVTNSIVNRMDATFVLRMQEDTGQTAGGDREGVFGDPRNHGCAWNVGTDRGTRRQ